MNESEKKARAKALEDAEILDFEEVSSPWNTVKCADGTVLKIKTVVSHVARLPMYNPVGQPVYNVGCKNIIRAVKVPKKLMRKKGKGEKPYG